MKSLKLDKIITKKFFEIGDNPCGASLLYDEADKFFREVAKVWLKQKRDEYTDNLTYPLGQRVLIGTFFIGLLEDLEK